jgi:hypothetical protein
VAVGRGGALANACGKDEDEMSQRSIVLFPGRKKSRPKAAFCPAVSGTKAA